ncbi:MAG TPA: hypothetical protein VFQ61_34225 [Polyangiaceae bacterium]|nr:hypothetical protein [Polyangiaceae bacterium]
MKKLLANGVLVVGLLASKGAWAQARFAEPHSFAISAERLFGYSHSSFTDEDAPGEPTTTNNRFSFLMSASDPSPWIAFDYFPIRGLSLGGAVAFASESGKVKSPGVTRDQPDQFSFLIMPRVGYAIMFNQHVGIWPRGGIGYTSTKISDDTTERARRSWIATIEVPFVFSPVPHWAFTVGPTFDFALSGTDDVKTIANNVTQSRDFSANRFGLYFGMLGYF